MTLEQAQQQVDQWIKTNGVRYFNELTNMAMLTEEVGEVARLVSRKYGDQSFKAGETPAPLKAAKRAYPAPAVALLSGRAARRRRVPFGSNETSAMRRAALSLALLACLAAAGGCATYVYDRAYDADYYHRRADDDVARYVSLLDRELDLSHDQERRVERLLASRTRHLLDHTRAYEYRRVYPFPREHRSYSRARRDWWRDWPS